MATSERHPRRSQVDTHLATPHNVIVSGSYYAHVPFHYQTTLAARPPVWPSGLRTCVGGEDVGAWRSLTPAPLRWIRSSVILFQGANRSTRLCEFFTEVTWRCSKVGPSTAFLC